MERNILFLSTSNSGRSQIAEALLDHRARHIFTTYSAGTHPRQELHPVIAQVMAEIGLDISQQQPKHFDQFLGRIHFEKVIIVCLQTEEHAPTIFGSAECLNWRFTDPWEFRGSEDETLEACRQLRDEIDHMICLWLERQRVEAQPLPILGHG
jgi:arsenate reductase